MLKSLWWQSQFSVAGPRNQRYLHPRSFGAGVSVCEVEEGCELAIEFYPELTLLRHESNLSDELMDALRSLADTPRSP